MPEQKPKPMTSDEFKDALIDLRMTNRLMADVLGIDIRGPQRWAVDEPSAPPQEAGLVRLMLAGIVKPRQIWQAVRGLKIDKR